MSVALYMDVHVRRAVTKQLKKSGFNSEMDMLDSTHERHITTSATGD
jgi:hypothetical protein